MSLSPGTLLGHYEVVEMIGAGGMGEIHRARDIELGRDVAIKVLRRDLASDPERLKRFAQEARAASALNHPNIISIYGIGEHEGAPYIAMEYLEGATLREALEGGRLPHNKLLRYATQIAEGLAKAHQAGIVHRDLKPDNVMIVEERHVKILDFGLAKLMPSRVDSEVQTVDKVATREGVLLGTVQYMSPEQAAGRSVDFRSDQFAFGSILYEMATGRRAFEQATTAETLTAIIKEETDPVTLADPGLPRSVVRVIDRCLAKEPSDRYASTWDIVKDLHWDELAVPAQPSGRHPMAAVGAAGVLALLLVMVYGLFVSDVRDWLRGEAEGPRIDSIAVLPLDNLSGDPEQDYLADGMTDALINELARIRNLRVISRTSVMQYKAAPKPLAEIARELDVNAVLEGSVLRSGNRIGMTAQLIDAMGEGQIWSGNYERDLEDVLVLRKEVARAVADEIRIVLTPEERAVLVAETSVDAEAYDAYQRGVFHLRKYTGEDTRAAIEYAEQSIERAPGFAPAHALLADAYSILTYVSHVAPGEFSGRARDAAMKALSIDEDLVEAHVTLAWIRATYDWDWSGAAASYQRALKLNPGLAAVRGPYSHFLAAMGRFEESLSEARQAEVLDPINPVAMENVVFVLYLARRFDEAIAEARTGLALHPEYMYLHVRLARALAEKGEMEDALEAAQEAVRLSERDPDRMATLGRLYAMSGRKEEAIRILGELEAEAEETYVPPTAIARIYVGLGDGENAFRWLERGYELRDGDMYLLETWPVWDPIRDDPRFLDLLRRMNFP